jgi:hypothetical protein
MKNLRLLVVSISLLLAVGCTTHPNLTSSQSSEVVVFEDASHTGNTLDMALGQVTGADTVAEFKIRKPAALLPQVLSEVQSAADRPIVAATEYAGWFWFATDVARDSETKKVRTFLRGYAIQKNSRSVMKWSVW